MYSLRMRKFCLHMYTHYHISNLNTGPKDHLYLEFLRMSSIAFSYLKFLYCTGDSSFSSVPFSRSVMSNSLRPHESQYSRPPCPSPTPRVHPNSCALSQWCHPAISSSVVPLSSCPQSLPGSGSFPMSQLLAWDGQSIGVSDASLVSFNLEHYWLF